MNGPELLQALMDAAGDNAYAVATSLKKPALQSYIWKFLNGKAKEPRRASLQPLADRYRVPVDAFYDPSLAERIAVERGLLVGRAASERSSMEAPADARAEPDEVMAALRVLADALRTADKATRSAIAPLLSLLASDPDQVEDVFSALAKLLPERPKVARTSQDDQSTGLTIRGLGTGGLIPNEQRDSDTGRRRKN